MSDYMIIWQYLCTNRRTNSQFAGFYSMTDCIDRRYRKYGFPLGPDISSLFSFCLSYDSYELSVDDYSWVQ